ncbi:MAG: acyl-CoA thioesterase [Clostridia bacterium]|nr:acyl-CoA thioesterase [Clostridia bacterium]
MKMYKHRVQYYETDKMGITHHSNYIRWMEEARVDFLEKIGYGYDKLEKDGIISPVVNVNCDYRKPTTFADDITIDVVVEEFKGIKLIIRYTMTNQNNDTVCTAHSSHCFVNAAGRPIHLSKMFPDFAKALTDLAETK